MTAFDLSLIVSWHWPGFVEAVAGLCGSTTNVNQTTTPSAEKSSSYSAAGYNQTDALTDYHLFINVV